jgi:moderate conductance mechanosensitive channel
MTTLPSRSTLFRGVLLLAMLSALAGCDAMQPPKPAGKKAAKAEASKAAEKVQLPAKFDRNEVEKIVAQLSDEQARRLLIAELKKDAAKPEASAKAQLSGFSQMIKRAEATTDLLKSRWAELHSGIRSAPQYLPQSYAKLHRIEGLPDPFEIFISIVALIASGLGAEWVLRRRTGRVRQRLESTAPSTWMAKMKELALIGLLEMTSLGAFLVGSVVFFFAVLDDDGLRRLMFLIYAAVVLLVRLIGLLSRFVFSPSAPALRTLPLSDATAGSIHGWVMRIAGLAGVGLLAIGFIELERESEAMVVATGALTGLGIALMLMVIAVQNRKPFSRLIRRDPADCAPSVLAFHAYLADIWHILAILQILVLWLLWVSYLFLGQADAVIPLFALWISVPLFLVLNGVVQKLLDVTLGYVESREGEIAGEDLTVADEDLEEGAGEAPAADKRCGEATASGLPFERIMAIIRQFISISIGGAIVFWVLRCWGFDVNVGREVTKAAFEIGIATILCFIAWKLVEQAISRKLASIGGMQELSDEHEMGGEGGSRVGTLLHLLRKFLLVGLFTIFVLTALSAMGIDIKPLLAGAGIVGLAIGFGSQTLVKDIISGVFYLVDDAFRIGDYVDTGKVRGTVEHISVRSLRLRHSRGMVLTIPFSQLGAVTNFSRDYIIEKLEFRVSFATPIGKVKKIVKKIHQEIEEDETLRSKLLAPIKFQGVKALDDSAMIMRIKFKTRPGEQFIIRREIFIRLQKAFEKGGLEFAHRQVIVRLPVDTGPEELAGQSVSQVEVPSSTAGGALPAGAGAAIAAILTQEEAQRKKAEQEESS